MSDDLSRRLIERAPNQVSCELEGETVLMESATGKYFKLSPVGTRIWALLALPNDLPTLASTLVAEYEIDEAKCLAETREFIQTLHSNKLVRLR